MGILFGFWVETLCHVFSARVAVLSVSAPTCNHRTLVALNELVLDITYDRVLRHSDLVAGGSRIDRILALTHGIR
jgi:hypothetical protein